MSVKAERQSVACCKAVITLTAPLSASELSLLVSLARPSLHSLETQKSAIVAQNAKHVDRTLTSANRSKSARVKYSNTCSHSEPLCRHFEAEQSTPDKLS